MNFLIKLVIITCIMYSIKSESVVKIGNVGLDFSQTAFSITKIVYLNDGRIALRHKNGLNFYSKNGSLVSSFGIAYFIDMKAYNNELIYYDGVFVYKINPDSENYEKIITAVTGNGKLAILGDSIAIASNDSIMVYNLIKKNFEMIYKKDCPKFSISMTEDYVFATTSQGKIISIDRKSQKEISKFIDSYDVYDIACLNNNLFSVISVQGQVYIFDAKTFTQIEGPYNTKFHAFPAEIKKISESEIAVLYSGGELVVTSSTSSLPIKLTNGEKIISVDVIDKDRLIALDKNGDLLVITRNNY